MLWEPTIQSLIAPGPCWNIPIGGSLDLVVGGLHNFQPSYLG